MKKALVLLAFLSVGAHAESADFFGNWRNPDPKPSGLSHVVISPNGGERVDVRAYGNCHPNECDWGFVQGQTYSSDPKSKDVEIIVATFHFGFAHHQITFRKLGKGQLSFEMLTEFADNSERHDYAVRGTLKPSVWAGPVVPLSQSLPGLATGWGGGVRSGVAKKPVENCKEFDTKDARAVEQNGLWRVVSGGKTLADAGHDDKAAMIAEAAFRHYHFNRRCTAGGPWKAYWKTGDAFANERIGGPGCIKFNPTTVHLVRSGGAWKIVDGSTDVVDFGTNKIKADATLALIRVNALEAFCFVRQPDPILTFWTTNSIEQH